jgi:fructokinase
MIVVCGEALVDLVPAPGSRDVDAPLVPHWGGGPFNAAIALGRLGAPVRFLSRLSNDPYGEAMLQRLRQSGVETGLVQRGPEQTSLAVVSLTPEGSARYGFYFEGTADRLVADPGPLPGDTAAIALGTCSLVLEPGASVYERILLREAGAGRVVCVDPNIRSALIADPDAYRTRFRGWLPSLGLLKVSDEDAVWLAGDDPDSGARAWLRAGVSAVVVTRGATGLVAYTDSGVVEVPAVPTRVVDTIGAGDTAYAALLARLAAHRALSRDGLTDMDADAWRDVLGFAAAAAAITCSRPGADPPTAADLGLDLGHTGSPQPFRLPSGAAGD